ncbi:hypothetical protein Pth03_63230 [Planotetraspora thailandica]|uniref:Uncharacterized protein n=1 Tax=Planotetraspora thailandica TaxID=487172 RepID=A0A8J3XYG4_9ACTN|nr:hypothetical protein Pth03_63230 [Planotetraspora thailandica]
MIVNQFAGRSLSANGRDRLRVVSVADIRRNPISLYGDPMHGRPGNDKEQPQRKPLAALIMKDASHGWSDDRGFARLCLRGDGGWAVEKVGPRRSVACRGGGCGSGRERCRCGGARSGGGSL